MITSQRVVAAPMNPHVFMATGQRPMAGSYVQAPQSMTYSTARPSTYLAAPAAATARTVYMQQPAASLASTAGRVPVQYAAQPVTYVSSVTSGSATIVQRAPVRISQAGSNVRPHNLAGPSFTEQAYEAKHKDDDPQLQNLKELRKNSGLKTVPVAEGLKKLKSASVEGKLTREQFLQAYQELLEANNIELPAEEVRNAVFDLFDRDSNHVVDMMEVICGISLLCAGKEDDKIHAVFDVFDENGDGFISMDEMFKFLTSVFKVVLTPNVIAVMNSMGVTVESAEDLASVTSLECFKTADLNHDGKLSVTEFKNWFYAPRSDPSFLFSPVRKLLQ